MIKISHRGNLIGPNLEMENTVEAIFTAIGKGFDVEIDVWVIDGIIYFGHNEPERIIDTFIIDKISSHGWFHCKNLEAISFFIEKYKELNYFWHEQDDFTLTSSNHIWTYPGKDTNKMSILVDLDLSSGVVYTDIYGVCSDYIGLV